MEFITVIQRKVIQGKHKSYRVFLAGCTYEGVALPVFNILGVVVASENGIPQYAIADRWLKETGWYDLVDRIITNELLAKAHVCLD